jgi:hypothetical protein
MKLALWLFASIGLVGCSETTALDEFEAFEAEIAANQLGSAADHWIEIKNALGEWERVGLVYGYVDDSDECKKAIAGLQKVNFEREYRCVPAQP